MGTVYEESRTERHGRDTSEITRILRVDPYTYVPTVLAKLLGTITIIGGRIFRTLPHQDPYYPGCFCVEAKVSPFDVLRSTDVVPAGLVILDAKNYSAQAKITAEYKTMDAEQKAQNPGNNEQQEKDLASESFDFGARNITLPNTYYSVGSGTDKVILAKEGLQATKTIPTVELQTVRHFCATLPDQAIGQLAGRVNADVFIVAGRRWPAETARFDGLHSVRKFTTRSLPLYELQYKYALQVTHDKIDDTGAGPAFDGYVGWNRIYRPSRKAWARVELATDATVGIYRNDTDISQNLDGSTVSGFDLLYHPAAK